MSILWIKDRLAGEQVFFNYSYILNGTLIDYDLIFGSHWTNITSYIETHAGDEFFYMNISHMDPSGVTKQIFSSLNQENEQVATMWLEGTKPKSKSIPPAVIMLLLGN